MASGILSPPPQSGGVDCATDGARSPHRWPAAPHPFSGEERRCRRRPDGLGRRFAGLPVGPGRGRPLGDCRGVGLLGAAVGAGVPSGGRRRLFRRPRAARLGPSHQSGLCRADDRAQPADAEKQPDQFPPPPRSSPRGGADRVSRLEDRAAADLATVPAETAVDRARIVRLGYVLAALVVLACPLRRSVRPRTPWSPSAASSGPGPTWPPPPACRSKTSGPAIPWPFTATRSSVSADLSGLRHDEPVTLFYSTADGQSVDQSVELSRIGQGNRYQAALPPGDLGLQQDLSYRLVAGDCNTRTFHVEVQIAPAIVVDKIDYHYPSYTGLPDRSVPGRGGDIRALEGTRATIHATANRDIQRAEIDLDGSGRHGVAMEAAGKTASGTLTLALDADDPTKPQHESYQVLFTDAQGRGNNRPIRYRIEVVRDRPPEVKFAAPEQEEVQVPVDGQLEIGVWAQDPDFGLRRVAIRAERDGASLPIPPLLACPAPEKAWEKIFQKTYTFKPAGLGLKAGDRVTYWAEAEDNKEPVANHAETAGRRLITVIAGDHAESREGPQPHPAQRNPDQGRPEAKPSPPQPEPKNGVPPGKQPPDEKVEPSPEKPEENSPDSAGAEQKPDQQPNKPGEQSTQPEEPRTNSDGSQDPDVIAKINEERQKQEQQKQQSSDKQNGRSESVRWAEADGRPEPVRRSEADGRSESVRRSEADGRSKPVRRSEADGRPEPARRPEADGRSKPIWRPEADGRSKPIRRPEADGRSKPIRRPEADGRPKPIRRPEADGRSKPIWRPDRAEARPEQANQSGRAAGKQSRPDSKASAMAARSKTGDRSNVSRNRAARSRRAIKTQSGGQKQAGRISSSRRQPPAGQPPAGSRAPNSGPTVHRSPAARGNWRKAHRRALEPKPGETPGGERTGTNEQKFSGPKAQDDQQPQDSKERTGSESRDQQQTAGAGKGIDQTTGSPPAQNDNEGPTKQPGDAAQGEPHTDDQTPDSPSVGNEAIGLPGRELRGSLRRRREGWRPYMHRRKASAAKASTPRRTPAIPRPPRGAKATWAPARATR